MTLSESEYPHTESSTALTLPPRRRITRTRTGCKVCRRRKIKCDLEKPECAKCVKYGVQCTYPGKQPEFIGPRSIRPAPSKGESQSAHKRQAPSSLAEPAPVSSKGRVSNHENDAPGPVSTIALADSPQIPLMSGTADQLLVPSILLTMPTPTMTAKRNTVPLGWTATLEELGPLDRLLAVCRNTRMGLFFIQPSIPPDFLRSFFPSSEDLQCFHHCITYTLSIIVVNEERNPWSEHVAPLFMSNEGDQSGSQALRSALLYLGAVHLSYLQGRNGDTTSSLNTRNLALKYRTDCVRLLRSLHMNQMAILNPTFFSACALSLTADLLAANNRWRELMRMVKTSIKIGGGMDVILFSSGQVNPAMKCAIESLINLSLLGELVGSFWCADIQFQSPQLRRFDASCGISRSLVLQLSCLLSVLSSPQQLEATTIDRVEQEWVFWDISKDADIDQRTQFGSLAIWHAGRILIMRTLRGAARIDPKVQEAAVTILEICASVGDKVEYLNWPLIVACSTLVDPEKREIARLRLKEFKFQCCYELEIVQMVCEEMWVRMDEGEDDIACGWVEILLESGCPVLLG
uniref:Zn(2)-C6 fungal-type domain-containing protein n=1 Tax=Kwoniella pini CBS 10737 TaxID=1296096 RepID=A0A1B9I711_9TREE|nr:uncharacterized protein I206_02052 [Kwoniella pini CBS 10737]OCF51338.1 hypothetical protein I206_02052 [Kwoniella pini CBS 10737]